jgi:trehalose/maltose transport system permease protein
MSEVVVDVDRQVAVPPPRRGRSRLAAQQTKTAWLLLIPTLLIVVLVALVPLAQTVYLSFTNDRLADLKPAQWIGAQNYRDLLHDQ